MRYAPIDTISFTDILGNSYPIKDMREYKDLTTHKQVRISQSGNLDEIATRRDVYDEDSEHLTYLLFDHNKVKIVDAGFSLLGIKELDIPQI